MRIMKSKATDSTYHEIQDVKRDWKRSTEIIENLRNSAKSKEHKILIPFITDSVIEKIRLYHLTLVIFSFRKFTTNYAFHEKCIKAANAVTVCICGDF